MHCHADLAVNPRRLDLCIEGSDLPPKNRVGGSRPPARKSIWQSAPQPPEPHREFFATPTTTASGICYWTAKDPIDFGGGDENLGNYAGSNPISQIDPSGLLVGDQAGQYAAEYYASQYVRSGNPLWVVPGLFASLWTPQTSERTLEALFMAGMANVGQRISPSERTPSPCGEKPPGWGPDWEWRYPESSAPGKSAEPRWFDPKGGEWRWHQPDSWHPDGHWDHNPWDSWNSPWRNVPPGGAP